VIISAAAETRRRSMVLLWPSDYNIRYNFIAISYN
jgi:hypothetical protein